MKLVLITMKLVQINLNRSRGAQDLMLQYMRESKMAVALVSEPNRIPRGNWLGDMSGLAAIHWETDEPCALIRRGPGYVLVKYKGYILRSCYCSPNVDTNVFKNLLGNIGNTIVGLDIQKIIIGGDLNARSRIWDRNYNERGYILEEWIAEKELVLVNEGKTSTCVRTQGSSIVDITVGTERTARGMSSWKVDTETETLSDHKYIRIEIDGKIEENRLPRGKIFPRWNMKKIDKDWFATTVICSGWLNERRVGECIERGEIEKAERILKRTITDACNNSMKREKGGKDMKGKVYWWSTEITEIREGATCGGGG